GIAVPEPGPADTRARLVGPDPEAHAAQAMDGVEAGQAAADDGDIELPGGGTMRGVRHLSGVPVLFLLCERWKSACFQRSPAWAGLARVAAGHIAGARRTPERRS